MDVSPRSHDGVEALSEVVSILNRWAEFDQVDKPKRKFELKTPSGNWTNHMGILVGLGLKFEVVLTDPLRTERFFELLSSSSSSFKFDDESLVEKFAQCKSIDDLHALMHPFKEGDLVNVSAVSALQFISHVLEGFLENECHPIRLSKGGVVYVHSVIPYHSADAADEKNPAPSYHVVKGFNQWGDPRSISVFSDGRVVGFNPKAKSLGFVENLFEREKGAILGNEKLYPMRELPIDDVPRPSAPPPPPSDPYKLVMTEVDGDGREVRETVSLYAIWGEDPASDASDQSRGGVFGFFGKLIAKKPVAKKYVHMSGERADGSKRDLKIYEDGSFACVGYRGKDVNQLGPTERAMFDKREEILDYFKGVGHTSDMPAPGAPK